MHVPYTCCNKRMLCWIYGCFFSAPTRTIYLATVSKNMDCSCKFLYQFLTSEKLVIVFSKSKLLIYYGVMYDEYCRLQANTVPYSLHPIGNFADMFYQKDLSKLYRIRYVCILYTGALACFIC